jgi:hypothetical protein
MNSAMRAETDSKRKSPAGRILPDWNSTLQNKPLLFNEYFSSFYSLRPF